MDSDDDTLMRDRVRPKASIQSIFGVTEGPAKAAPVAAERAADASDPLPGPDDEYRAYARPVRQETGIAFLSDTHPYEGFGYFDLRRVRGLPPAEPGGSPLLVLRFVEAEVTEVVLSGWNLFALADYLRQHRIAWIRKLPHGRTVSDPQATVVTSITYREAVLSVKG